MRILQKLSFFRLALVSGLCGSGSASPIYSSINRSLYPSLIWIGDLVRSDHPSHTGLLFKGAGSLLRRRLPGQLRRLPLAAPIPLRTTPAAPPDPPSSRRRSSRGGRTGSLQSIVPDEVAVLNCKSIQTRLPAGTTQPLPLSLFRTTSHPQRRCPSKCGKKNLLVIAACCCARSRECRRSRASL